MKPSPATDEEKMQKLGDRIRSGWSQQHPVTQQSLQTVRDAVRDQYTRDQKTKQSQPPPTPAKQPPKSRGIDR